MTIDPARARLIDAARTVRLNAAAAFSGFEVGAALEAKDGRIFTGCNVENATYGLTVCAERVAVFKAISEGCREFVRVAVVADTSDPTPPCGACRQILWEFGGDLEVILANLTEMKAIHSLGHCCRTRSMQGCFLRAATVRERWAALLTVAAHNNRCAIIPRWRMTPCRRRPRPPWPA